MKSYSLAHFTAGAFAVGALAFTTTVSKGPEFIAGLQQRALAARDATGGQGIDVRFITREGWLTRHPMLSGGEGLDEQARARAAVAISKVPGVGGVRWRSEVGDGAAGTGYESAARHCQDDVEAILAARSIRFAEASARIDRASERVLDEVADALEPCVGSTIAITGHTDSQGDENANIALSQARAEVVRWSLIGRGIPASGLRYEGKGSREPIKGLVPTDPANRRIEFSVIEKAPLKPTPIDTPGPG